MKPPSKADLQRARINNLRDVFLVPKVSPQSWMTTSDLGKHPNNLAHGARIRGQKMTNLETKGCRIHTNYSQGDSVVQGPKSCKAPLFLKTEKNSLPRTVTSPDDDCVVKTCALVAAGHYEVQGMEARLLSRQLQPQQLLGLKEKKRSNVERVEDLNIRKY